MLHTLIRFVAANAISAFMLSVGLRTDTALVADLKHRWGLVLRALAVVWLGVPLLVIVAVWLLRVPPLGTATLLLMAICPGVPFVVISTKRASGSARTALLVLLATLITAPVMVPLWAAVIARSSRFVFVVDAMTVLRVIIPSVILPFAIGRIINRVSQRAAVTLAKLATIMFVAGIAIAVAVLVVKAIPVLAASSLQAFVAVVVVTLAAAALGYAAGGPHAPDRIALGYAAALGNPALALAIAARTVPTADPLPLVAAYVLVRILTLVPFGLWSQRRSSRGGATQGPRDLDEAHGHGRPP
jgi:BASS family bile acid:Na+ symporter